jgi:hypothetical protein
MSLKSRKRHAEKNHPRFPTYPLPARREAVNEIMTDYAILSILFLVLALILLTVYLFERHLKGQKADESALYISAMLLPIVLFFFNQFLRSYRIGRQLKQVAYASEETLSIHCSKVSVLCRMLKWNDLIVCIILKDDQGNCFYYVYPLKNAPHISFAKHIDQAFINQDLTLICYKNSHMIKELPLK